MFSLRDLRFALCSFYLDVLRAQRIIGFFNLHYPQINEVRNSDYMTAIHENRSKDTWPTKFCGSCCRTEVSPLSITSRTQQSSPPFVTLPLPQTMNSPSRFLQDKQHFCQFKVCL